MLSSILLTLLQDVPSNARDVAATRIQAVYRGYVGRKQYVALLYEQFEKVNICE